MKLFSTKVWSVCDIALLKWSALLFGMLAGAYLAGVTRRYARFIAIAALLLAIKPGIAYFSDGMGAQRD